jgi:hypothetical protein
MTKISIGGLGVVILAGSLVIAQQAGSAADEVLRAFRAAGDAQVRKDKSALEQLFADDYSYIHSNGIVANKAEEIAAATSADMNLTSLTFSDLKARLYGDAAIVTGTETLLGTAKGYVPGPRRLTDVLVKRGGRWQTAGGISTVVSKDTAEHAATSAVKDLKARTISTATADERRVLQADEAFARADGANDQAKQRAVQTKDFSFVSRAGVAVSPADPPSTPTKSMTVAYDRVRIHGSLAVVQGSLLWTDVAGFSPGVLRFQRVWIKEGGAWKIAAEQRTPIASARPTS